MRETIQKYLAEYDEQSKAAGDYANGEINAKSCCDCCSDGCLCSTLCAGGDCC